jgi:hypothetical protein
VFSGKVLSETDDGGSTITGSAIRNEAVNIKNVTNKNAKSTIGVISMLGACFAGFIFGMTYFLVTD